MYRLFSANGYWLDSYAKLGKAIQGFRRHTQAKYLYKGDLLLARKKV